VKRQRSDAFAAVRVRGGHGDGYPHERRNLPPQKFGEKIPHHHRKFHSQALRPLGDEMLYQALIAIPEHAGHAVRDNRRREGCAEGCGWRGGLIRTKTIWSVPIRFRRKFPYRDERLARFRRCFGFRSFHLAFWLLLSRILSAARHCVRSHAGHVTERPRLGFPFARSVAAEVTPVSKSGMPLSTATRLLARFRVATR